MERVSLDPIMQARWEIAQEKFRAAVEREKARIRLHKPWWHSLCPFVITIKRRD